MMKSEIMDIPYAYKPLCMKPKDEVAIDKAVNSSKERDLITKMFKDMTGKEIKEKIALTCAENTTPTDEQMDIFMPLFDIQSYEQLKPNLLNLSNNLITASHVMNEIYYFCYKNDFSIPGFFRVWTIMFMHPLKSYEANEGTSIDLVVEKVIGYANDGITALMIDIPIENYFTLYSLLAHNFLMVAKAHPKVEFNDYTQDDQGLIIENTFNSAISSLEESFLKLEKHKEVMGISHRELAASMVKELERDKDVFVEAFSNNRSYSRLQKDNHYLRALKNPNMKFADNLKYTIVAEDLERGLIIGYTSKHLSLLIGDKRTVIAELERNLDVLKKYGNSTDAERKFTEKLISFTRQTRYADYYPYKAIAKFTGMKKSEVKNLCKKIFQGDRSRAIDSSFDDLTLIEP